MPRQQILYALSPCGDLEPVVVKSSRQVARSSPNGDRFPDTILTVEDSRRQRFSDYAYRFLYVPFIAELYRSGNGKGQSCST